MALRFLDSFDHLASGDLTEKYHVRVGSAAILAGQGRRGTACLTAGGSSYVILTLDAQARWTVGVALRYSGFNVAGNPGSLLELAWSSQRQVRVVVTPEGYIGLRTGNGDGTALGASTQALHTNVWYYVESSLLCHPSAGAATVRVDGVTWLDLTGVNTQPDLGGLPTQIVLGSTHPYGAEVRYDDLYICDAQGSGRFTTFLGDCRVDALHPNADGTYTAWTPSSGSAHYPTVDEPAPNDDTDYVSATTGGTRDAYQLEPLPTMPNPEVLAVQACVSARKEDVDEILISPLLVSGGVTALGTGTHELNASYKYALDLWTADPGTGGTWTEAAINSLQVGVERLA
jgi:hypothetical protein